MNDQAAASALYALEPDQEVALRAHLPGCPSCREIVRDAESIAWGLAGCVEQLEPPARLRSRILELAAPRPDHRRAPARSRHGRNDGRAHSWRRAISRRVVAAAATVLLAVAALVGYSVDLQRQRDAESAEVQALTAFVTRLGTPGAHVSTLRTADGRPVAIVLVTATEQTLLTTALPVNDPTSSTYVVWGVGNTAPRPIGTLDSASADTADPSLHALLPPPQQPFLGYAVSLEPGRRAPETPTHIIATGQLGR